MKIINIKDNHNHNHIQTITTTGRTDIIYYCDNTRSSTVASELNANLSSNTYLSMQV